MNTLLVMFEDLVENTKIIIKLINKPAIRTVIQGHP